MPSFRTEKFIFIHFPKTGGMWFYHVCKHVFGIEILEESPAKLGHQNPTNFHDWDILPWIVFYRNPLDWYASLYNYQIKTGWRWRPLLKGISFHNYVELCLATKPYSRDWYELVVAPKRTGHQTGKLRWFPPTYMIQYENMYEELEMVLNGILGHRLFNRNVLSSLRKINTRNGRGIWGAPSNKHCPALTPELRAKIMEVDKSIFDLYKNHDAIVAEWQTR